MATTDELHHLIETLDIHETKNTLFQLYPEKLADVVVSMPQSDVLQLLNGMPAEKISKILSNLDQDNKIQILKLLPRALKREIDEVEKYPLGTAGFIMDPSILMFNPTMTAKQAIEKLREKNKRGIRVVFLVNEHNELHSMVTIQQLVLADELTLLDSICQRIPCIINDMTPQDEIVEKLEEHNMTDIPVVDIHNHFIGVVRHHSIIVATKEELTKDIQTMVGVSQDERALSKVSFAVRKRLPWLEINLLTAFLAAAVVGLFEGTIAKYTALAVLLPVVAGQSGNTGAQALAVTMRGLALKEVRMSHWFSLMFKELKIASFTGIAVAIPTSLGVYIWSHSVGLMFIIFISMILSMIIAGVSGAAVPLVLVKFKQDPASASSIILTTVTDICGFFSFLGIATALSGLI
jgi:magnesium transporter